MIVYDLDDNPLSPARLGELARHGELSEGELVHFACDESFWANFKSGFVLTDRRVACWDDGDRSTAAVETITQLVLRAGKRAHGVRALRGDKELLVHELVMSQQDFAVLSRVATEVLGEQRVRLLDDPVYPVMHLSDDDLLICTTDVVQGRQISDYLGIVAGEALSSKRDAVEQTRELAMRTLRKAALAMGANAVVGVRFDYELGAGEPRELLVGITGSAVRLVGRPAGAYR